MSQRKEKIMLSSSQTVFSGTLIPNAPVGMYAAMVRQRLAYL